MQRKKPQMCTYLLRMGEKIQIIKSTRTKQQKIIKKYQTFLFTYNYC